ncbi:MAG: hypothetical protein R3Y56_10795 [Akkermansia sp.]
MTQVSACGAQKIVAIWKSCGTILPTQFLVHSFHMKDNDMSIDSISPQSLTLALFVLFLSLLAQHALLTYFELHPMGL